jgi:hypothetical protein
MRARAQNGGLRDVVPQRGHESPQSLFMRGRLIGGLVRRIDIKEIVDGDSQGVVGGRGRCI